MRNRTRAGLVVLLVVLVSAISPVDAQPRSAEVGSAATVYGRIYSGAWPGFVPCLDLSDWGRGGLIQVWQCHDYANQRWHIDYDNTVCRHGVPCGRIINLTSGKCIHAFGTRGQQLGEDWCWPTARQNFDFRGNPNNALVAIESDYYHGQCMDIRNSGASPQVQLWDCNGGWHQAWDIREAD
jgi:hypothetical protein